MTDKITRSDVFARPEKGPDWFADFLQSFADNKNSDLQDILNTIKNKTPQTVDGIVQSYKEQVGLNLLSSLDDDDEETVKTASEKSKPTAPVQLRKLSKRHVIAEEKPSIIILIEKHPEIVSTIDSFCRHSGGNKGTIAIINFLRGKLGHDVIRFSDEDLVDYINKKKESMRDNRDESAKSDPGRVGLDEHAHEDDLAADYFGHGKV